MKRYYTSFVFAGHLPADGFHCTHTYFGKMHSPDELLEVLKAHFDEHPFVPFAATFDEPDMFGPYKNTAVLKIAQPDWDNFRFDLWEQLLPFQLKTFPLYQPHVTPPDPTLQLQKFSGLIRDYVLIEDKKIIWRASK